MAQSSLSVGGINLNPLKINKPFLNDMLKATEMSELKEGKASAKRALKEFFEEGTLSETGLEHLDSYAKAMRKEWKEDKKALFAQTDAAAEDRDKDVIEKLRNDLVINAPFLGGHRTFTNELREATALAAVQGIAGADFGPTAAVAGYAAYLNPPKWNGPAQRNTQALVDTYKDYLSGESRMTTEGNSVKQVHRAELWKTLTGMTREAAAAGKAGKPLPITAQYYELTSPELVGNLADAAKAGSKLRLNMDVGRLSYPSTDETTGEQFYEVDDLATKMRTVKQFTSIKGADVGVSIFPSKSLLGSATDLMHRKVLRVGEKVLMSGMNGNMGSGENVDAGYVVEGPAAKRFTENVARDIANSTGATLDDIWGEKQIEKFKVADLRMGTLGLTALFDAVGGPSPAGSMLKMPDTAEELEKMAKDSGFDIKTFIKFEEGQYEDTVYSLINEEVPVSLSDEGKKALMGLMRSGIRSTHSKANVKALGDITPPSGKEVGKTTVDIADLPEEREVLTINAINEAEEFIYVPGFVVTRAVSGAIVARKKEAEAEGKPLDIKIIADPGVYPFGGTPNSYGVNFLEENGIPVRWAKLRRTNGHDRKVHAKQVLTDKGEIAGSTNFSKKGMRENWETSAYVRFEEGDAEAQALKDQSKAQFEDLWNNKSYPLSTQDLAAYYSKDKPEFGHDFFVETAKGGATRQIITGIENYEVETGVLVGQLMEKTEVSQRRDELLAEGYSDGDAALMAVDQVIGKEEFQAMADELPTSIELDQLAKRVESWKSKSK